MSDFCRKIGKKTGINKVQNYITVITQKLHKVLVSSYLIKQGNPVKSREQEDEILIEVKNLVKKYGNHMAIDHLNFKIEKGQVYGFLGPNGAGKSTTMNIMTGYLGATEGEVLIDGHDILKEPKEAKKAHRISAGIL